MNRDTPVEPLREELVALIAAQAAEFAALRAQAGGGHQLCVQSMGRADAVSPRRPRRGRFQYASAEGGLLSYGPDFSDFYVQQGLYMDRIPRGTKPNELPVQVPSKFELVVNLRTAKMLGLEPPATSLGRADEGWASTQRELIGSRKQQALGHDARLMAEIRAPVFRQED
jgi:hypothetical protein